MHTLMIDGGKRGHKFEEKHGGVHGRAWREEREG